MAGLLSGKTALITGSRRGMGMATLELFAQQGSNIWACARKTDERFEERLHEIALANDVKVWPLYFDLDNPEEIKTAVKTLVSAKVPIDILVNNAGISINALLQMSTSDILNRQISSNFVGPLLLTQYISKIMGKYGGGNIINIASIAGIDGPQGRVGYGGSKAALICATKVLSKEFAPKGIRVNAIAPGVVATDMLEGNMTDVVIQETIEHTCLKRLGQSSEIANVTLFLASDLSSYLTGQVIRADGGKC